MMKIVEITCPPSVDELIERFGARRLPFVLDSSLSNDGLGQWSFFGAEPFLVFEGKERAYIERRFSSSGEEPRAVSGDGLDLLRGLMAECRVENASGIPFVGGAVGFLAYDYGRQIELLPRLAEDDRELPDLYFGFYDGVAALNHETGVLSLITLGIRGDVDVVLEELREIVDSLEGNAPSLPPQEEPRLLGCRMAEAAEHFPPEGEIATRGAWTFNIEREAYLESVRSVRRYIASGDVYQVNLSHRARCRYEGGAVALYRALRVGNPAPYSAFIAADSFSVLSTSPEQLLRKRGRSIETRPIKGTRPRGETVAEDRANAEALRCSEKDRAELLMIVDLVRNDLGRVAEFGSVHVEALYHQEHYARVMHQTAQVKATLAAGCDVFDCIRALFPGGSITGAPKIRAMEVIEELEPTRRGVYTGSVGYLGFDGNAELNIAIRSLHLKGGYLDYQVGGGIVWDSDPESEYQETLDKGRAIRETVDALCRKL